MFIINHEGYNQFCMVKFCNKKNESNLEKD